MREEDGRREAVAYLEHSKRSLCYEAVGSLRLLMLLRVLLHLRDRALLRSLGFGRLSLGLSKLLHFLSLSPADVIRLPGALEGVQELIQAYVSLHELLQQLL